MPRYIFTNVGRGNVYRQARAFLVSKSVAFTYGRRGWVEIGESDGRIDEKYRLRLAFPKRKWRTVFPHTHTPITFLRSQRTYEVERIEAAKGYSGGWPNKWWVRVAFDDVVMYNGHMPPGAFNKERDEKYEKQRLLEWNKMWNILREHVHADLESGKDVIVMTDANRQVDMPKPHYRAKVVAHHKTDYIWAIPSKNNRVKLGKSGEKTLGIDFHKAIWADVDFERNVR